MVEVARAEASDSRPTTAEAAASAQSMRSSERRADAKPGCGPESPLTAMERIARGVENLVSWATATHPSALARGTAAPDPSAAASGIDPCKVRVITPLGEEDEDEDDDALVKDSHFKIRKMLTEELNLTSKTTYLGRAAACRGEYDEARCATFAKVIPFVHCTAIEATPKLFVWPTRLTNLFAQWRWEPSVGPAAATEFTDHIEEAFMIPFLRNNGLVYAEYGSIEPAWLTMIDHRSPADVDRYQGYSSDDATMCFQGSGTRGGLDIGKFLGQWTVARAKADPRPLYFVFCSVFKTKPDSGLPRWFWSDDRASGYCEDILNFNYLADYDKKRWTSAF